MSTQSPEGTPTTPPTGRWAGTPGGIGPIAYGCWRFAGGTLEESELKIRTALDCGMNLIDTADIYGYDGSEPAPRGGFGAAEELLGRVLSAEPSLREEIVLATKGGITPPVPYDSGAGYLRAACEASLRRLGVDHVELYQVHRPDLLAHPAEVAGVLDDLVREGKVLSVGVSNYSVAQTTALEAHLEAPLVSTQPQFSALCLDPLTDGTLDHCMKRSVLPLAWSPLGGGRLLGGAGPDDDERTVRVAAVCDRIAAERGTTRAAVLLAWVMAHPARCVPIIGTQDPERIRSCARAVEVELSRSEWYEVLVASRGEAMP